MSVNQVVLDGHLTRDPETREAGGTTVCNFRIGHNDRVGGEDVATFFNVAAWGKLGEVCSQYLAKGSAVVVAGSLQVREYEHDGAQRTSVEVRASQVHFASKGGAQAVGGEDEESDGHVPDF